LGAKLWKYNN